MIKQREADGEDPSAIVYGASGEEAEVGSSAHSYLRRVDAWERVTRMPMHQRGIALYTSLRERAWVEAEALDINRLSSAKGAV